MNRDISLDILRGLMLIIMASDHFGEPVFQHLYEFSGYVSAAEGFVFLSGMLVALVYSRYYAAGGLVLEKRVWQRAGTIYFYHFFVLLAVFVFTVATKLSGAYWLSFANEMQAEPTRGLLSGLLLVYQPPMLDVLPMYVAFMLAAPFALRLMLQYQLIGVAMVLLGSGSFWLAAQYGWGREVLMLLPKFIMVRVGAFDFMAWQLVFVLGMVLGYLRFHHKHTGNVTWLRVTGGLWITSVTLAVALYLQRHGYIPSSLSPIAAWFQEYRHIARDNMAWLRLINFLAFVVVISGLISLHQRYNVFKLLALPGRWLAFLGQHSLQVFAYHLVVLYCYIPFRWGAWALTDNQKWVALVFFIASLSLPALWHKAYLQRKKQAKTQNLKPLCNATMPPVILV
ncbi:OpgC domain-containing protein [Thiothrix lacustris]|uniref:OpgC domain-containing protein n=1 Tax=Thiothrix lacustris TaxID=525917 RepID=UPI0027E4A270|nr:OpgC domain-containing protein [Thiothrix lacustris]WMP18881.1 OpgC domain-containing protein [Thiothrix lacustris]